MTEDWKYGDVLRRAIVKNPVYYQRVMYVGPAGRLYSGRKVFFRGIQLSEPPALREGEWAKAPPVGAFRPALRRELFEKDPDAD